MPGLPNKRSEIEGQIGFFGLVEWWLSTFTPTERIHIEERYKPFVAGRGHPAAAGSRLTTGKVKSAGDSAAYFLQDLAFSFTRRDDRHIARRILSKAEELAANAPVLDRHFLYLKIIQTYNPDRDVDPGALDKVIDACQRQIDLAPEAAPVFRLRFRGARLPEHRGFEQLANIREKLGEYKEAIRLNKEALRQGWVGDWKMRIDRCEKKLAKVDQGSSPT
jgi:tetratricopeptide (TPR) repeat protein